MYFCRTGNNKSTFQPEGAAPAASSLKSSYFKNEEKLSKERGTLNIQSTFNQKRTLLTPRRGFLTRFVFDSIIGFHHSSDDYNTVYAIGFIGNRVYSIFQNGDINLLPLSKDEYLSMKHEYYESVQIRRRLLQESRLKRIIRNAIRETVGL